MQKGNGALSKNWVQWPVLETCFRKGMKKEDDEKQTFSQNLVDHFWMYIDP